MKKLTFLSLLLMVFVSTVIAVQVVSHLIGNDGNLIVSGVEAYFDSGCTIIADQINWGNMEPNDSKQVLIYVLNTGTTELSLTIYADGFTPTSLEPYLLFEAHYIEGKVLAPDEVYPVSLELTVQPNPPAEPNFSFTIHVEGSST